MIKYKIYKYKIYKYKIYIISVAAALLFFLCISAAGAEDIVTTTEDAEDYNGFRVQTLINPAYENRDRDVHSGVGLRLPDDSYGFTLRRSHLRVSKEWKDSNIEAAFQADVIRNHELSRDTALNSGAKADPYLVYVSNAYIQKGFQSGNLFNGIRLGIQEVPMYYFFKKSDQVHYLFGAPEELQLTPNRSDIGLSWFMRYNWFAVHLMGANGEGALQAQGKESSGFDALGRVSFEPPSGEILGFEAHLYYRRANIAGFSGNECREGRTPCLASDGNAATNLEKDLRSLRNEYYGGEFGLRISDYLKITGGVFWMRDLGGRTLDLAPGRAVRYEADKIGIAEYLGFTVGPARIKFFTRFTFGTGSNGRLTATRSREQLIEPYVSPPSPGIQSPLLIFNTPDRFAYEDKSVFRKIAAGADFTLLENCKITVGAEFFSYTDSSGGPGKSYVDVLGNERTKSEYTDQYRLLNPQGIAEYSRKTTHYFVRAGVWF